MGTPNETCNSSELFSIMEDNLTSFNKEGLDPSAGLALHTVVFKFLKEFKVVDLI